MWVREGECNQCGECCKSGNPLEETPVIPGACALYREDDNGLGFCSNRQHPYYLGGCNVWPSQPSHIEAYPSCSYTFRWTE